MKINLQKILYYMGLMCLLANEQIIAPVQISLYVQNTKDIFCVSRETFLRALQNRDVSPEGVICSLIELGYLYGKPTNWELMSDRILCELNSVSRPIKVRRTKHRNDATDQVLHVDLSYCNGR